MRREVSVPLNNDQDVDRFLETGKGIEPVTRSRPQEWWWYRWTAPPIPSKTASFVEREVARRGRLASVILLFMVVVLGLTTPLVFLGNDPVTLVTHLLSVGAIIGALIFNRRGQVALAGILVVAATTVTFMHILTGNIGVSALPLFDLMILSELIAVSLLPARWVFIVAGVNSVFAWFALIFLPHAADLAQLLSKGSYAVVLNPILLYLLVAVVTYLWVRSASQAIERADRAEEIAALEQREIERQQQEIQQKQQVEMGIQQILQTHVQVANGNFSVRTPLTQENILWRIAYSLNNLIARLQRYNQNDLAFKRAMEHSAYLIQVVRNAKGSRYPIKMQRGGTFLDPLVLELNNCILEQSALQKSTQEKDDTHSKKVNGRSKS